MRGKRTHAIVVAQGSRTREEASAAAQHFIHDHQVVLPQGSARGRDVHDAVGHPDDGTQLDITVQGDDVHLLAFPFVVVARDARVFGRNANATAPCVRALRLARSFLRLGDHETARTVAQVDELNDIERRLDERVATAHAAIGTAARNEGRRVCRPHDNVLHAAVRRGNDKAPPRLAQLGHVQANGLQRCDRIREERTLRHGNAQRTLLVWRP